MTEILAPCGGPDALRMAIAGGADAVYLGLKSFSARASAANFSREELMEATEYAHGFGVRVYVALNTLAFDRELPEIGQAISDCAAASVDALIVQDFGLMDLLRQTTNFPIHASTQAGVYNEEGARMARELGCCRVVLARESERGEAERIRALGLETEQFVHGALCTGFSGNCYLSSFLSSASGNRGRCLQPCRLEYECLGERAEVLARGRLLSSRDECLLGRAGELHADSWKIEGRLKRPEYAGECARVYRLASRGSATEKDRISLKKLYCRGEFLPGLSEGRKDVVCGGISGHLGVPVGKVLSVRGGIARTDADLVCGDGCKICRGEREIGGGTVLGDGTVSVSGSVRPGDTVFLTTDVRQLQAIAGRIPKLPISVSVFAHVGERVRARAVCKGVSVEEETAEELQQAQRSPVNFSEVFARTGDTSFALAECAVEGEGGFLPKSAVNDLRRRLLAKLWTACVAAHTPRRTWDRKRFEQLLSAPSAPGKAGFPFRRIGIFSEADPRAAEFDCIVFSPREYFDGEFGRRAEALRTFGKPLYLDIPIFLFRRDFEKFRKVAGMFDGIYAHNLAAIALARECGLPVIASPDLNACNRFAVRALNGLGAEVVLSEELMCKQAADLLGRVSAAVTVRTRQVLMNLNHCAARETLGGSCADCRYREMAYRNGYGQVFPLERVRIGNRAADGRPLNREDGGEHCYFRLLNGLVTDKRADLASLPAGSGSVCDCSRPQDEGAPVTFGHWKRKVQ